MPADGPLDRRFEAVVLVGEAVASALGCSPDDRTAGSGYHDDDPLGSLVDRGMTVALVGGEPADGPLQRLRRRVGQVGGTLIVAPATGGATLVADRSGEQAGRLEATPEGDGLLWVREQLWQRGVGPGATVVVDLGGARGVEGLLRLLADQRRRRDLADLPMVAPASGWGLDHDRFDPERERFEEALFALGDGSIGISGAPVAAHPGTRPWALAAGAYDGQGPDTHLLPGPIATCLPYELDANGPLRRVLDLRSGVMAETLASTSGPVAALRFVSLVRPGTVVLRARLPATPRPSGSPLLPPDDGRSATPGAGPGLGARVEEGRLEGVRWMRANASSGGIVAAALDSLVGVADQAGAVVLDRVAVYEADGETPPDPDGVVGRARAAADDGFDRLLDEHRRAWAARWADADVTIEGDDELQEAVRFTLFHLMASVGGEGEAAVGARGLTGSGYRGHVFWDADTFVLPFLAACHPDAARAMLEYRLRRLPAALAAARAGGCQGARFPWESARSGRDVTPTSARDRAGRLFPVRTGRLEEHIVSEVAWAADCYTAWTGDEAFRSGPGLRLLVETARYWASRIRLDAHGRAHIDDVIGPDEYHEGVDDNAFTNVMARWNLRRAAEEVARPRPSVRAAPSSGIGAPVQVGVEELRRWESLAAALVDGYDAASGLYEQFRGFARLEPLVIEEVAPRRPIAADLLLGFERVRAAQVVKQADVVMLHHLVPDEVAPGSLEPNLRYYEPRTAHGSSLSPGIHAALFARIGDADHALEALRMATRIDLDDLTGTTSSGLHLATMGGVWQALAFGFAGLRPRAGRLAVDPFLPPTWAALDLGVRFRGRRVRVRAERDRVSVHADPPVELLVGRGAPAVAGAAGLELRDRGEGWEVAP